jgi:hypothetical protein
MSQHRHRIRIAVVSVVTMCTALVTAAPVNALAAPGSAAAQAIPTTATEPRLAESGSASTSVSSDDNPFPERHCDPLKGLIFVASMALLGALPAVISISSAAPTIASFMGTVGYYGFCVVGRSTSNSSPDLTSTITYLIQNMEKAAGEVVDQRTLQEVEDQATDLMSTLDRERSELARVGSMSDTERAAFAVVMQTIGNTASQLEAKLQQVPWQALPAVAIIGAIKMGAYSLAAALWSPGTYQDHLTNDVIPAELAETRALLSKDEAGHTEFVTDQVTVSREAGNDYGRHWHIDASATLGTGIVYQQHWGCTKTLPSQCGTYDSRRLQFFGEALAAHQSARVKIANLLGLDYLRYKAMLEPYGGLPLMLINNRTVRSSTDKVADEGYRCLGVRDNGAAIAASAELESCKFSESAQAATDQAWRFVPGTGGELQDVKSKQCLDVEGTPDMQTDGSRVVLGACADPGTAPEADQQWAIHPLGYLVNLASGRCLDLNGLSTTDVGAVARVAPCEYGRSPMPRPTFPFAGGVRGVDDFRGVEGLAASTGVEAGDTATDQSWSLGYLGLTTGTLGSRSVGRDRTLPAPPPPTDFAGPSWWQAETAPPADTTPPALTVDTFTQQAGATTARATFTVDETAVDVTCQVDDADATPCTSPYTTDPLVTGNHVLEVRAVDAAGNAATVQASTTIDADPPVTTIVSGPSDPTTVDASSITFTSDKPASTFTCSLDDATPAPCSSPTSYPPLGAGDHRFVVAATAPNGVVDADGATLTWTVRKCLVRGLKSGCLLAAAQGAGTTTDTKKCLLPLGRATCLLALPQGSS